MTSHGDGGADGSDQSRTGSDAVDDRTAGPDGPPPRSAGADDGETGERVSITVDEEHRDSIGEVAEALRRRGMQVEVVLESLGMVTGSATDAAALEEVEGVSSVDRELEVRLPPPDEDIQ